MQHRKRNTLGAIVVLLALAVAGAIPVLRKSSPTFNFLFSPSDLHSPLTVNAINLAREGQSHQISFENRYPGRHMFAIQVENPVAIGAAYTGAFILQLEVSKESRLIFSELIKGPGDGYWGRESGIILHWYSAPGDLPLQEPLQAEITILQADETFESKYGPLKIVVKKLSDG